MFPASISFPALDAWIINGNYVTPAERGTGPPEIDSPASMEPGEAEPRNERKKEFLERFSPSAVPPIDLFSGEAKKLRYLIEDLDYRCELDWSRGPEYVEVRL